MKKITLTSTLAILIAGPAIAAVGDATFTAGQNVANSCVIGVLGVDTGTAQTNAYWNPNTYSCAAGTYLPDGDTWSSDSQYTSGNCAQCTAGSYCAGSGNSTFTYSEASDQGITSCGSTYPNSDAGSDAASDCYRNCTGNDVAHLKSGGSVTGRYYSTGTNECGPADSSQCATGYHYVAGAPDPDLTTIIGTTAGTGGGYIDISGQNYTQDEENQWQMYNLSQSGTWAVNFGTNKGVLRGSAQCSTQEGTGVWNGATDPEDVTVRNTLSDSTGSNCYCQLTSYTPNSGSAQPVAAPWVYSGDFMNPGDCQRMCAGTCKTSFSYNDTESGALMYRTATFNSLPSTGVASCVANTISINWKDASGNTHELGSCTYDGALTTPTTAPTKRGHTFGGWKFVAQP